MLMASNVEATKKGYEWFEKGDIPTLIRDLLDERCTWISPGPPDKLPWAGTFKGKQEIATFFGAVRNAVGIRCGAFSGNMKVSFQAARSIG
jgi:hypothetical protein